MILINLKLKSHSILCAAYWSALVSISKLQISYLPKLKFKRHLSMPTCTYSLRREVIEQYMRSLRNSAVDQWNFSGFLLVCQMQDATCGWRTVVFLRFDWLLLLALKDLILCRFGNRTLKTSAIYCLDLKRYASFSCI